MHVGKSVTANQDRISGIDVPDERSMERMKRLDQELVELEAACDYGCFRKRATISPFVSGESLMTINELRA
jgi:hypothetical protein